MRPKLFFQALLGIVSVGAIIMIVIVYFFGDNQTKVVEKVVEKEVIVYRDAPAAVTPTENYTVVQQPAAPAPAAPAEVAAAPAADTVEPFEVFFRRFSEELKQYSSKEIELNTFYMDNTIYTEMQIKHEYADFFYIDNIMGGEESVAEWNGICEEYCKVSADCKERASGLGYGEMSFAFRFFDSNATLLLEIKDGEKTFDYFEIYGPVFGRGISNGNT